MRIADVTGEIVLFVTGAGIGVDALKKIVDGEHDIAEEVHENIEKNFSKVKHIMVHVNPAQIKETENREQMV